MFIWSYSKKLEILLLCVQSGWNRILIALVQLRKWKVKWVFHILHSSSSIVVVVFPSTTNLNMQNLMVMLAFSAFDQKYCFWANLVQKIKIVTLNWNLVLRLISICRIQWWFLLFGLRLEIPVLGKFGPKDQNCDFKLELGP